MPFPNHPEKYDSAPVITPERDAAYAESVNEGKPPELPDAVVLCYGRALWEYFTDAYSGTRTDLYPGGLYTFDDTDGRVGVLGDFGIGAPVTAMVMESAIAAGVEAVLSVGFAGCLDDSVGMGEFVVCERAIRDEGTSHHYRPSERYAEPSASLSKAMRETFPEPTHVGPSWTTDAVYQETEAEIERYAAEGVLTVEMEAATVFTVAAHREVEAGAAFVASDYLGPDEWDPQFHVADDDIKRLGDAAKDALDAHVAGGK